MDVHSSLSQWEDLRKQARYLENEIDIKLSSFSKLGAGILSSYKSANSEVLPLLSTDEMIESMNADLEQLLIKLAAVNEKIAEFGATVSPTATILHTIQRHRDILQEYQHEFRLTKSNIQQRHEREALLNSANKEVETYQTNLGLNKRADLLMKENEHLKNSSHMIDEQINIAMETKDYLYNQRETFKLLQTKMNNLTNRFPMINSLMHKIGIKKRKDSLIMGCTIGICCIFLLWYILL